MDNLLTVLFTLAFAITASSLHGKLKDCKTSLARDEGPKQGPRNDNAEIIYHHFSVVVKAKLEVGES